MQVVVTDQIRRIPGSDKSLAALERSSEMRRLDTVLGEFDAQLMQRRGSLAEAMSVSANDARPDDYQVVRRFGVVPVGAEQRWETVWASTLPVVMTVDLRVGYHILGDQPRDRARMIRQYVEERLDHAGLRRSVVLASPAASDLTVIVRARGFCDPLGAVASLRASTLRDFVAAAPGGLACQGLQPILAERPNGHLFLRVAATPGLRRGREAHVSDDVTRCTVRFRTYPGHEQEALALLLARGSDGDRARLTDQIQRGTALLVGEEQVVVADLSVKDALQLLAVVRQLDDELTGGRERSPILSTHTTLGLGLPLGTESAGPRPGYRLPRGPSAGHRDATLVSAQQSGLLGKHLKETVSRVVRAHEHVQRDVLVDRCYLDLPAVQSSLLEAITASTNEFESYDGRSGEQAEIRDETSAHVEALSQLLAATIHSRAQGEHPLFPTYAPFAPEGGIAKVIQALAWVTSAVDRAVARRTGMRRPVLLVVASCDAIRTDCFLDRVIAVHLGHEPVMEPGHGAVQLIHDISHFQNVFFRSVLLAPMVKKAFLASLSRIIAARAQRFWSERLDSGPPGASGVDVAAFCDVRMFVDVADFAEQTVVADLLSASDVSEDYAYSEFARAFAERAASRSWPAGGTDPDRPWTKLLRGYLGRETLARLVRRVLDDFADLLADLQAALLIGSENFVCFAEDDRRRHVDDPRSKWHVARMEFMIALLGAARGAPPCSPEGLQLWRAFEPVTQMLVPGRPWLQPEPLLQRLFTRYFENEDRQFAEWEFVLNGWEEFVRDYNSQ